MKDTKKVTSKVKKITKLTKEQIDRMPEFVERWTKIGLDTTYNEDRAKAAVLKAYKCAGLKEPKNFIFCGSPYAGAVKAAALMTGKPESEVTRKDFHNSYFCYGSFEASWLSFYSYFMEVCDVDCSILEGLFETAKECGWWWPFEDTVIITPKPTLINRDEQGRLHSLTGAAVLYPDGFGVWAVHGVRVPKDIIEDPSSITPERIQKETNAEVRRVMIDKYGKDRYIIDSKAKIISEDDYGVLYSAGLPGDEALVMVKVVNSTPEPDGSFKDYFLRVPPTIKTAREAVAWSFEVDEKKYKVQIET